MIVRFAALYFVVLTIPLALGAATWQSERYNRLGVEVERLEAEAAELVEKNKQLVAEIAALSSSARIAEIAKSDMGLAQKQPEDVIEVTIETREAYR
jgi:cell division protein FtsL